ncbi:FAD-binding oxidoreductase [Ktedonosporobacter rubrisoli]|uniref:FAD-binding oxidoreductase n=1 Tax=Ktedonosporobacter rubrisoli TaxID=2509675 RepID=A0A4P6JNW4_KTERU|nr:FAD-binding oxidoreductase [Ktedonosporobacter rubrisoli]QBD77018.1 FAD-binding oxidoreductase [Ktedonosporobacter rubrisoli]
MGRHMYAISRRQFLTLCGVGALAGPLVACQSSQAIAGQASPTAGLSPTPSPTRRPLPDNTDWSKLAKSLQGTLVRPDSPQYATARQLFSPRFDTIKPAGIAYCASPADVQKCLAFAQDFDKLPIALRAGGHSYAGYSTTTGLVIDVTRMNTVTVNQNTATIGAGTRLIDVYSALAQHGQALPAGSCPTVGVAGLTLGGGAGVLGRKFGLTCDNLLSAQVVLADGRILTCDAQHEADLFWALRGGGGGNFGIVTSFTFQTHVVGSLSLFSLGWPWSDTAAILDAWQNWAPHAPDELWSNFLLLTTSDNTGPIMHINGVYVGEVAQLNGLLDQLISKAGKAPTSRYAWASDLLQAMLYEAGCYNKSVHECHLPTQDPQGQLKREIDTVKSDYFTNALPHSGLDALIKAIERRQNDSTPGGGGIGIDSLGGAINRVAPDATAFAHRNALFSIQYSTSWDAAAPESVISANHAWLTGTWQAMRSYASGAAYQNYVDPDLADWQHAYYGPNLARLQRVKTSYDPGNFFHFGQSIPPASKS